MADHFVTVASYAYTPEAQMAKNLLEAEGIRAFLAGEETANALTGLAGEALLQVHAEDAARAVSLLAAVSARVSLDEDWEAQTEKGLWTCPVCGTAVPTRVSVCPACQTPNTSITTDRRDTWTKAPHRPAEEERVTTNDQIKVAAPKPLLSESGEEGESAPRPGTGCVVLLFPLVLVPLWLWC
jgi:hypothetical protein